MGRNSKQRRDAKKRRNERRSTGRAPGPGRRGDDEIDGSRSRVEDCDCLACRSAAMPTRAEDDATTEEVLIDLVRRGWRMGWQPAEIVRQIERAVSPVRPARHLVRMAIAVEARSHAGDTTDPRWAAQVAAIARRAATEPPEAGWMRRCRHEFGDDVATEVAVAVSRELASLGPLLMLIPPPGAPASDVAKWSDLIGWEVDTAAADADPLLTKVRALLAKAEATDFPEEAEAFTAKAHALMIDHAIDEAAVRGRAGEVRGVDVGATRLALNEPYAKQHLLLLSEVAGAAGARCIYHPAWAMATVVGARHELHRVEVMYTSLMVQAQAAFNAEAQQDRAGTHRRSRGFRSAFLTAYAVRIGKRLGEQRDTATAAASSDALPVLAADQAAVDAIFDKLFGGSTRSISFGASDRAGWWAGDHAAERARLTSDELRTEPTRRLTA